MAKRLILIIFCLTLLSVMNKVSTLYAQNMSVELDEIKVNSRPMDYCCICTKWFPSEECHRHCYICEQILQWWETCSCESNKSEENENYDNEEKVCPFCSTKYVGDICPNLLCSGDVYCDGHRPSYNYSNIYIYQYSGSGGNTSSTAEITDIPIPQLSIQSTDSKIDSLIQLIDLKFSRMKKTKFPNLDRQKFIDRLKELIKNPKLINQASKGTCGAATICKYMLEYCPEIFINLAAGIWEDNYFEINGEELKIPEGDNDCWLNITDEQFEANLTDQWGNKAQYVDIILQGAITNWTNILLDYNPFEKNSFWGNTTSFTTPGRITDFFNDVLNVNAEYKTYSHTVSDSYDRLTLSPCMTFSDANMLDFTNNFIIGLVGASDLSNDKQQFSAITPNHYVQLTGLTTDDNGNAIMGYWTWGNNMYWESTIYNDESKESCIYSTIEIEIPILYLIY